MKQTQGDVSGTEWAKIIWQQKSKYRKGDYMKS